MAPTTTTTAAAKSIQRVWVRRGGGTAHIGLHLPTTTLGRVIVVNLVQAHSRLPGAVSLAVGGVPGGVPDRVLRIVGGAVGAAVLAVAVTIGGWREEVGVGRHTEGVAWHDR